MFSPVSRSRTPKGNANRKQKAKNATKRNGNVIKVMCIQVRWKWKGMGEMGVEMNKTSLRDVSAR